MKLKSSSMDESSVGENSGEKEKARWACHSNSNKWATDDHFASTTDTNYTRIVLTFLETLPLCTDFVCKCELRALPLLLASQLFPETERMFENSNVTRKAGVGMAVQLCFSVIYAIWDAYPSSCFQSRKSEKRSLLVSSKSAPFFVIRKRPNRFQTFFALDLAQIVTLGKVVLTREKSE